MSADLLRQAATKLRGMSAAALVDLCGSRYYGYDPANFGKGIDNAVGGAAGELAALFSPVVADRFAAMLEAADAEIGESNYDCEEGCDYCGSHTWPDHSGGFRSCDMPVNVNGAKRGDWCDCGNITAAVAAAHAILGTPTDEASDVSRRVASDASPTHSPVSRIREEAIGSAAPGEGT